MDIIPTDGARSADRAAWDFLTEHQSCGLVELWCCERHIATLRREDGLGGLVVTEAGREILVLPQA